MKGTIERSAFAFQSRGEGKGGWAGEGEGEAIGITRNEISNNFVFHN